MSNYSQILYTMDTQQLAAASLAAREHGEVAEFNVAAWLNAPGCSNDEFSLLVSYIDGGKYQEVLIDRGRVNAMQDVLLSGVLQLRIQRRLEKLQLQMRSPNRPPRLTVENLCLQHLEPAIPQTEAAA